MSQNETTYIRKFPIRTAKLPYEPDTMLAPMEGVTDLTIRTALGRMGGIGILCTEFVRISGNVLSAKTVKKTVLKTPGIPLSVQVMGNDASKMADSAEKVELAGADIVDINLGCPTKNAVKGNVGSAMLKDPELLYGVLSAMRSKVKGWLSAKIRAGFDESEHVTTIAKAVQASGADFLIVHPRRRRDFYDGVADWRIIAHLKNELDIPVVGNGDIWYPQDAQRMIDETSCDGVMIGRGAMRNPFIFKQIKALRSGEMYNPSNDELVAFFKGLVEAFNIAFEGRHRATLNRMKELVKYFSRNYADGIAFRKEILRQQHLDEFCEQLYKFIDASSFEKTDFDGKLNLMKSGQNG